MGRARYYSGILATALLSACGGSGSGSGDTGTLTLGLTDATVDSVEQVRLYVTGVTVKRDGGPPQSFPVSLTDCAAVPGETDDCNPVDLLSLQDGLVLTVLADQELLAGRYQWLRLEVDESESYIVEEAGGVADIAVRIPSERGLQLSGGFVILADETTELVMDWDARRGLTDPVGQDGYLLKPTIRVIDMAEYGAIGGSVSDALMMNECAEGGVVYVFEGELLPADLDDIDNNDPNPLVTATVKQQEDGSYAYLANFLPIGPYTVALTCDVDDVPVSDTDLFEANDDIAFISPQVVTVVDGQTQEVGFQ